MSYSGVVSDRDFRRASSFYQGKLESNPSMPRYNHCMGALASQKGLVDQADRCYRSAIDGQPANILCKNDFAVHLANSSRKDEALHQLKKATLLCEDNPLIYKNLAAIQGNAGHYTLALQSATRARHLNPNDPMNHRNLAKLHNATGDAYSSLTHNLEAIALEKRFQSDLKPDTSIYRSAAVQIIAKGGSRDEAHRLMDEARAIEHKKIDLPTSNRTYELIYKIKKRYGDSLHDIERQLQDDLDKKRSYDYDLMKGTLMKEIKAMPLSRSIKY